MAEAAIPRLCIMVSLAPTKTLPMLVTCDLLGVSRMTNILVHIQIRASVLCWPHLPQGIGSHGTEEATARDAQVRADLGSQSAV